MTKQLKLGALLVALLASSAAMAAKPGYVVSQESGEIVRSDYDKCWHNDGFNKDANGVVECGEGVASAPVVETPMERQPEYMDEPIKLSANFLFGFDTDKLRPEASQALNEAAQIIKADNNVESVTVAGHTDFMGSAAYNQKLSERRALAVGNYLVNQGVNPAKIQAVGYGKTQAQMQATCEAEVAGIKNKTERRSKLIACNEPDRRVDITIRTVRRVAK